MAGYTIGGDPYLSDKSKSDLASAKAKGADLSQVEKFLRDTAPLVAPIETRHSPVQLIVVVLAIIIFAALVVSVL